MKDKIREIREALNLDRTDFEKETGIKAKTWSNIENGLQKANEDHLIAITNRWPEFTLWLMTGKTAPEIGQIDPYTERARINLRKAG